MNWQHKGIRIEADTIGNFNATVEDVSLSAVTLAEVRTKIDTELAGKGKRKLALKVVGILSKFADDGGDTTQMACAVLVGINRTTRYLMFEGLPPGHTLSLAVPDTPDNMTLVKRLIEARAAKDAAVADVSPLTLKCKGYGRIDPDKYAEVLDTLEADYNKILKEKS